MSQAGLIDAVKGNPQIPIRFETDGGGVAIPLANILEVLGGTGIVTSAESGNTVRITATAGAGLTLTGNDLNAISPDLGNWNTIGVGSITISGAGHTLSTQLTGLTNHSLLVGAGTSTITNLGVAGNGKIPIGSNGANPVLANITSTAGTITITNGAGTINLDLAGGGLGIDSLIPNSGTTNPVFPTELGVVTLVGTGSITSVGSLNTLTMQMTGLTQYAVLVGAGTDTITKVGPVSSTGAVLMSNGIGSDPGFSTATYPITTTVSQILYSSSTNVISGLATANNGVLITSATGIPSILAAGTTGQVMVATTGSPPTFGTALVAGGGTGATTLTGVLLGNGTSAFSTLTYTSPTSWTPEIQINGSSVGLTYTTQTGSYMQIGSLVFIWMNVFLSAKGASVGNVTISNLPVSTGASGGSQSIAIGKWQSAGVINFSYLGLSLNNNSVVGNFFLSAGEGFQTPVNLLNSTININFGINTTGFYVTN